MFPAYIDPVVPGLAAAFTIAMRPMLLAVAGAALAGIATIAFLVVVDATRARRARHPQGVPSIRRAELRKAA
jgi:hypothetical protein